jgi:DegV family protein with EDD domain
MAVKIVTDSSADIPPEIARELGITVIPLYLRFGQQVYRDGVDLTADQFYAKLARSRVLPKTSVPSPGDIARVYEELTAAGAEVISIHLSPRYSGTLNAALVARDSLPEGAAIEIVDSGSVSMGCGLVVMAAARAARAGASPTEIKGVIEEAIRRTHIIGMITDIRYLLGGRRLALPGWHLFLGKLGTLIRFKLVGEIYEAGRLRGIGMFFSEAKALARLERRVNEFSSVAEIAVLHTRRPGWAGAIAKRQAATLPAGRLHVSRLSGATGVHGGPNAVAIAFIEGDVRP